MTHIEAHGLRKTYGSTVALDGVDLQIADGRIVGLIGPNGAGKTTALNAIVGLASYDGQLRVLGRDPWTERDALIGDIGFITDVAVLPRWIRVAQVLDFVAGIHPRFDRAKAEAFLEKTSIRKTSKVKTLSKGMVTQLHLAIVMAIDARVLVLDEPTLGLDLLYRKQFYDALLTDFLEHPRTIVIATHHVEEVERVLTDVLFINRGRIVFSGSMEQIEARYRQVLVHPDKLGTARVLNPIAERQGVGHSVLMFEDVDRQQLAALGETRTPSVADLFVAVVGGMAQGAAS